MAQYFIDLSVANPLGNVQPPWALASVGELGTDYTWMAPGRGPQGEKTFQVKRTVNNSWTYVPLIDSGVNDFDLIFKVGLRSLATKSDENIGAGIVFRASAYSYANCYYIGIGSTGHVRYSYTFKMVDSTQTPLGYSASFFASKTTWYQLARFVRLQVSGNSIKARGWWEDESEGSTWTIDITDATYSSGSLGLFLFGYSLLYDLYWMGVGTEGDPPPTSPLISKSVSGTIYDSNGDPCERVVRLFHRDTGYLLGETLSDAVTGDYSIPVATNDEVIRIAYAANGVDLYNDLIDRVIPG